MTGMWVDVNVEELSAEQLGAALEAGANQSCHYRAAVELIVEQESWLHRHEFRQAVEAEVDEAGRILAWVDWREVDTGAPASSGELRILEIARSLGGIPSSRPLCDLLSSFDVHNTASVLRAFEMSLRGWAS